MKILLSYEESNNPYSSLSCSGTPYLLKIKKTSLFGLINETYNTTYVIPYSHDVKKYIEHWNEMIKNKSKF